MLNRTRALGAVAALVGGAALLTGCAQGATSAPAPGTNALSSQVGGQVQQASGQVGGTGQAQEASCTAEDVDVTLTVQPDRPGVLLLTAVNRSQQACTVDGWAGLVPLDMSNSEIEVPTQQVEIPGAPTSTRIEPGKTAFAGVKLELGGKDDPDARVATGFKASMPGTDTTTNARISFDQSAGEYAEFPVKSIQIGSFQPSAQGVTVF
ncbi:DUF4232 domain-containing protein [Saccharopolyspora hirsuta]|uniref:DUF4232 domain-containing protein n=1 Tax=Saccharopolyspora hirsuta TaxID=1837 RepID=A0A5M7BI26_SACHI|nr:DUF4232 domain-containing protein [Saccharopolyspora hirsuta]KAA5829179.1 DUF4232 domain-containing protein [Saccharopolyspora hirsuta]